MARTTSGNTSNPKPKPTKIPTGNSGTRGGDSGKIIKK